MGKTTRPGFLTNLDADKLGELNDLAARTRITRSVLMREAVDDLLMKHKPKKSYKTEVKAMRDAPIFPSAPQTQAQLSGPRDSITQFV
jgi:hypothetical protein